MRASRLLQILLLLQNRGRMTAGRLAAELEVHRRTILRDVDAMTEAGLPVVVFAGAGGGIELAFDYRTRLTGLNADEAAAMGVLLALGPALLADLGLSAPAARAAAKMVEAFPDQTRAQIAAAQAQIRAEQPPPPDRRRAAVAQALRDGVALRLQARGLAPVLVHPGALILRGGQFVLVDARDGAEHPEAGWGDINITALRFPRPGG